MKTVLWNGGSVVLDDDTVDAILHYSSLLARLKLAGTMTVANRAPDRSCDEVVLSVGLDATLTVHSSPTATSEMGGTSADTGQAT
ncbi:hypothetical protein HRK28_19620 [Rathayibacter sp. VKM Ac-2835]|uniref:hypothetical protein n=1 Tax=Rathayibacter sp. VKM Ac-2835 TaxID=2739043 RepID=UPI0015658C43|nr:hypothetical protein [Rathayibacter sp. VKM Ac-2835]NRG43121.1 hypothetical protein [Rathayibacter sp. VKM Ac-2835]